jgi:hypothetical protein
MAGSPEAETVTVLETGKIHSIWHGWRPVKTSVKSNNICAAQKRMYFRLHAPVMSYIFKYDMTGVYESLHICSDPESIFAHQRNIDLNIRSISDVIFNSFSYYHFIFRKYSTTITLMYYVFQFMHYIGFKFRQVKTNAPPSFYFSLHHYKQWKGNGDSKTALLFHNRIRDWY